MGNLSKIYDSLPVFFPSFVFLCAEITIFCFPFFAISVPANQVCRLFLFLAFVAYQTGSQLDLLLSFLFLTVLPFPPTILFPLTYALVFFLVLFMSIILRIFVFSLISTDHRFSSSVFFSHSILYSFILFLFYFSPVNRHHCDIIPFHFPFP